LALQDNIGDDISPEATIKDLGFFVRAPVAAIATIPYILSAGVWLLMTKVLSTRDSIPPHSHHMALVDKKIPLRFVKIAEILPGQNRYTVPARPRSGGFEEPEISTRTELSSRKRNRRVRIAARRPEVRKGE